MNSRSGLQLSLLNLVGLKCILQLRGQNERVKDGENERKPIILYNSYMAISSLVQEHLSGPLRGMSVMVVTLQYPKKWCNSVPSSIVSQQMHQKNVATDTSSCCPEMPQFSSLLCKTCCLIAHLMQEVPYASAQKTISKVRPCL